MSDLYDYNKKKNDEQVMIKTDSGRRKKEQFIENLKEGDTVNDFFAVKIKSPPRPYKNGTWFNILTSDKTGEISVKFWGGDNQEHVKRLYNSFQVGDVIQVRQGNVEVYEDKPQISVNEKKGGLRRCSPEEYDVADFVSALPEEKIDELLWEIKQEIENFENIQLKNLLKTFFDNPDFVKEFSRCPSAVTHHHNYIGGNLEHTASVVKLCKKICETYPKINQDLLVTGAILHDIGKLKEYHTTAAIDRSSIGNFIGHIVIGDRWIKEKIEMLREKNIDFDEELETHLSHMILSHHGKYEYGSPRMPKTLEANILHHADNMDAQVKNFIQVIEEGRQIFEDEEWGFMWDSESGRKRPFFLKEGY